MKIKTKRGPRRVRNQRVIDRRFVVTDYKDCSYITAGKLYKTFDLEGRQLKYVINDLDSDTSVVLDGPSGHFAHRGTWYHPIR